MGVWATILDIIVKSAVFLQECKKMDPQTEVDGVYMRNDIENPEDIESTDEENVSRVQNLLTDTFMDRPYNRRLCNIAMSKTTFKAPVPDDVFISAAMSFLESGGSFMYGENLVRTHILETGVINLTTAGLEGDKAIHNERVILGAGVCGYIIPSKWSHHYKLLIDSKNFKSFYTGPLYSTILAGDPKALNQYPSVVNFVVSNKSALDFVEIDREQFTLIAKHIHSLRQPGSNRFGAENPIDLEPFAWNYEEPRYPSRMLTPYIEKWIEYYKLTQDGTLPEDMSYSLERMLMFSIEANVDLDWHYLGTARLSNTKLPEILDL